MLARQWVDTFRTAVARRADPLAPRRVLHGLRPGPLGDLPETTGAAGITPAEARTTTLRALTVRSRRDRRRRGSWCPPAGSTRTRWSSSRRHAAAPSCPRWPPGPCPTGCRCATPPSAGWPERRGTVAAMTDELARTRTASLFLEPWPMRGGHDGVLGEGVEVGVQFWEESPDGDLLAPGLNRFGDRVPAGTPAHHDRRSTASRCRRSR